LLKKSRIELNVRIKSSFLVDIKRTRETKRTVRHQTRTYTRGSHAV